MAGTTLTTKSSGSLVYTRRSGTVAGTVHRYQWPAIQLNIWILVMLVAACTILGIMATFVQIQLRLDENVPWYFAYYITICVLVILYIGLLLYLIIDGRLLPSIVIIGAFILFILWLVGLVVISIELWGPTGSVSSTCNLVVFNQNPHGVSDATFSWMMQKSICQSWHAVFAFGLVGAVFLLWIMIMSYQVFVDYT
ncbi:putative arginase-like protein [Zalerion maritima]|uniref:Arginase-like protein n=1 Tax=Zalerion maritima TaxID=339359 RepID=A0AAD5RY31_9PEZI|nr:putative arginase-like protein [Zalerion maritima]